MDAPAGRQARDLPLADLLVDGEVGRFLATAFATARAAAPYLGDKGDGYRQALDDMQYRHLSGAYYRLTPLILAALRSAGLLVEVSPGVTFAVVTDE